MTFLRGTITYQQLVDDQHLFKLICGEVADDFSVTAAIGDRWERISTNKIGCPGSTTDSPTNINNVNMFMYWSGETASQQAVSITLGAKGVGLSEGTQSDTLRLQIFTNGALVNDTDLIAYWISVTKDRVIVAIQGDTNHSGNMNLMYVGTYRRLLSSGQDPYPVLGMVSHQHQDEYTFNVHVRSQLCKTNNAGWLSDRNSDEHRTGSVNTIISSNPNVYDSKWYLYTLYVIGAQTAASAPALGYRGKLLDLYALASTSWSNRDILTDGVDSWRLIFPFRSNTTATAQDPQNLANSGYGYFAFKQT